MSHADSVAPDQPVSAQSYPRVTLSAYFQNTIENVPISADSVEAQANMELLCPQMAIDDQFHSTTRKRWSRYVTYFDKTC